MQEIQLTRGLVALVDDVWFEKLSEFHWYVMYNETRPYARTVGHPNRLMHRLIMKAETSQMVDHKNGNSLDNRLENLRFCTNAQNQQNRRALSPHNSSGFKGVCWSASRGKWMATITNGKNIHLGSFSSPQDAARAYDAKALELFGEFARINFPPSEDK